MFRRT
jgi:hypothetical protein